MFAKVTRQITPSYELFTLLAQGGGENYFMDMSFSSDLYLHFYSLIKFYFITHCKHTRAHTQSFLSLRT